MLRRLRQDVNAVGALEDDLRRELYVFIRGQGRPVSRDEAAKAVGISRKLAAFHLDKLVDRGLLSFEYARPPGRGGRGAGRPAKWYRPSDREVEVSIPERRYDVLGAMLMRALRSLGRATSAVDVARKAANDAGVDIGRGERERLGIRAPGAERAMAVTTDVLERTGYEPYRDEHGCVRVRNCPFHALAEDNRDLVCRMNESFVRGIVRGLGNETVDVVLDPVPGECCVRLEPSSRRSSP
jgi:predicted ArsR family transcriptional regulator